MNWKLIVYVLVIHSCNGERVVDVASHAAEKKTTTTTIYCKIVLHIIWENKLFIEEYSISLSICRCAIGTRAIEVTVHQSRDEVRAYADDQSVCNDSQDTNSLQHVYPHTWGGKKDLPLRSVFKMRHWHFWKCEKIRKDKENTEKRI